MGTCPDKDVEWMVAHIKSLEKKLKIAKEALVFFSAHYSDPKIEFEVDRKVAREALEKIEGLG